MQTQSDFSVQFGRGQDMGMESQSAFPYIYTFVNNDDPASALFTAESIGPFVPAASKLTKIVTLDPDYTFKLLAIKYTAYLERGEVATTWYENAAQSSYGLDPDMETFGTPLTRYIKMSLSFAGSGSEYMYGGANTQPQISASGASLIPIPVDVLQGYDYGFMTVRTPRLLPMRGAMVFEITNTHTRYGINVGAAIYGMKIRV
jgi:hypothetical protein